MGVSRCGGNLDSTQAWSYGSRVNKHPNNSGSTALVDYGQNYNGSSQQQPSSLVGSRTDTDDDTTTQVIDAFLSRDNRNSFIVRVYAILTVQLLVTAVIVYFFASRPEISQFVMHRARIVPLLSIGVSSAAMIWMTVSERARTTSPLKWNLLTLFTLGEALSVGFISSLFPVKTVLTAMLSTAVATATVTTYTVLQRNSKYDLSQLGRTLSTLAVLFLLYGVVLLVAPPGFLPYNEAVYSLLGAALFSVYLAYHTRLIVSGKHSKYQLDHRDYVFGAMTLYSDIINMFIFILRLLASDNAND